MNNVSFPGLGLDFSFSSIAFSIFDINIYWYSICIVLGIIVAVFLCGISKEKYDIEFVDMIDIIVIGLIFGIIGARLYYVAFRLDYYLKDPIKILMIRDGGLAIYGGLILGALVVIMRARKLDIKAFNLLDCIAPFVAIAQSIGRWGNFFNVEAYGSECNNILRMTIHTANEIKTVHPTFLYESICTFVIFCILRILQKNRKFEGQIFLLYVILYSFIRLFIEGLRADSLMFLDFRISQIVSIIALILGISSYLKLRKQYIKMQ